MIKTRFLPTAELELLKEVARGKHGGFIVGIEKTAQRLKAKRAKAV